VSIPRSAQFPHGSIIQLESAEQEDAAYILMQNIELAEQTKDPEAIAEIRALWDGEEWEDILGKARCEGSTWYVWWMDGVRRFMEIARRTEYNGVIL